MHRAGALELWLPEGEELRDVEGIAYWSPDPAAGRFTVSPPMVQGADQLLAGERARGTVTVEHDERDGGRTRLRYRIASHAPREVVRTPGGRMHTGGADVDELADWLFLDTPEGVVRAGYLVRASAPPEVRETFARMLESVRVAG